MKTSSVNFNTPLPMKSEQRRPLSVPFFCMFQILLGLDEKGRRTAAIAGQSGWPLWHAAKSQAVSRAGAAN
ncbi:hypothetical protein TNCV_1859771 [Trichonephila clavipes]|nr:hypothetical protein TNCV_1859771 [Trichonephila clavipes]